MTFEDINKFVQERKESTQNRCNSVFFNIAFENVKHEITEEINEWLQAYQEQLCIKDGAEPLNSVLDFIIDMLTAELLYILAYQWMNVHGNDKED